MEEIFVMPKSYNSSESEEFPQPSTNTDVVEVPTNNERSPSHE